MTELEQSERPWSVEPTTKRGGDYISGHIRDAHNKVIVWNLRYPDATLIVRAVNENMPPTPASAEEKT